MADNKYVVRAEDLPKSIVATTVAAKGVIEDIKTALANSDPALLRDRYVLHTCKRLI